jgi:hypothetical protein
MRSEVLMGVEMMVTVFRDMTPYGLADIYLGF